jgi:hypothetical protein
MHIAYNATLINSNANCHNVKWCWWLVLITRALPDFVITIRMYSIRPHYYMNLTYHIHMEIALKWLLRFSFENAAIERVVLPQ